MSQQKEQLPTLHEQGLLDSLQVGVLHEKDGKVVWANRCFFELFGYTSNEIIGKETRACFQDDQDFISIKKSIDIPNAQGLMLHHKDGQSICCNVACNPVDKDDATQGCTWTFSRIGSGDVANNSEYVDLIEKVKWYEALLRHVQIALLLVKDRKVVWANQCFYNQLGYSTEELIGHSARTYFHNDEDFVRIGQEGYPLLREGKPYASELLLKCRDGRLRWCLITGNAIDLDNPDEGYIWTFVDITDRIQAEAREREAVEREQSETEKMAALGVVVAGVAHEINTPIGVSYTLVTHFKSKTREFVDLFEGGSMKRSDLQRFVDLSGEMSSQLMTNISRAADLIQSFKKIAVDQSSDDQREYNLKEYLQEISMSLTPTLRKTPHRIEVECPDDIAMNSYPGALSQVITNLVMNALIHAFDEDMKGLMRVTAVRNGDQVHISFSDDGKGIPAENLPKIFDPFFTTKRGAGGSGLGLNIVFNMVTRKLLGRVTCSSVEGQGTLFKIEIPLEIDSTVKKQKEDPNDLMQSYKRTINKIQ
jgi:PAS domain S-box-containing protein